MECRLAVKADETVIRRRLLAPILVALFLGLVPGSAIAQKTDSLTIRNGGQMLGEIKELQRGLLKFKTDAMSTVYVEWPKVVSVKTDKTFEIQLDDGRLYFGSLTPGTQDSVVIKTERESLTMATQRVVSLQRIKPSFWEALDGGVNLGFAFTQQNAKTDFNLNGDVHYAHRGTADSAHQAPGLSKLRRGFALTKLSYNSTFRRQDSDDRHRPRVLHLGDSRHRCEQSAQRNSDPERLGEMAHQLHRHCQPGSRQERVHQPRRDRGLRQLANIRRR